MPYPGDFETNAGTRLFIVQGRASDDTEAAYETLFASVGVEEFTVTAVGVVEGRSYNTAEIDVVSQRQVRRKLGNYTLPDSEWGVLEEGPDGSPAAYILARDAMQSGDVMSFAALRESGTVFYWTAQVSNLAESGGGSNDAITYSMPLLLQTEAIRAITPVAPGTA